MVGLAALATVVSLGLGLTQPPYLGVACPHANSTRCGRVGVAVWVNRPATAVEVTVQGVRVTLHRTGSSTVPWIGYVHLRLRLLGVPSWWTGIKPITVRVRILRAGKWRSGSVRTLLHPGWG
jgi:hypothetical protein